MGVPSPVQLAIIAAICIIIFGGKRITDLLSGAGKSMVDFKKAMKEVEEMDKDDRA